MTAGASAVLVAIAGGTAAIATVTATGPRIVTATAADRATAGQPGAGSGADGAGTGSDGTQGQGAPAADARIGAGSADAPGAAPVGERVAARTTEQPDRAGDRPQRADAAAPPAQPAAPQPAAPQPGAGRPGGAQGGAAQPPVQAPAVTTRTVTEKRAIPYRTRLIRDPELPRGRKRVQTPGVMGEETLRWLVTYRDGRPADRRLMDSAVTRQPQHRVVAFGTRRGHGKPDHCRPGSDHCFPIGRDANCPAEQATPEQEEQARKEVARPAESTTEFLRITPEELTILELDPGLLC